MRRVMCEVLDIRILSYKCSIFQTRLEVMVKVPVKGVTGGANQWYEPDYTYIKRLIRPDADMGQDTERRYRQVLVGRKIPIPALEKDAEKQGYRIDKHRRGKGK